MSCPSTSTASAVVALTTYPGLPSAVYIRPPEHRVQQHIAAGGQVFGFGVLDLVVADPADARHKDHRGGCDARHVDGVVPGAADDVLMRVGLCRGGVAHRGQEVRAAPAPRTIPEL